MIAALFLQAGLGAIGPQALPAEGCAAYLWTLAEPRALVAMAAPMRLRITLDGKPLELVRIGIDGPETLGLAPTTRYAAGDVSATLTMRVEPRADLTGGALVTDATLTVAPAGRDTIVAPVGGLIGCS